MPLEQVPIGPRPPGQFEPVIGPERMARFLERARELRARFNGRVVWNVNSTATGGGVAELLRSLLAYARGAGFDARWVTVQAPPEFFQLTKQIHNCLHGIPGAGPALDHAAQTLYEEVSRANAGRLAALLRPQDVVLLHDPQTAGLIPKLVDAGALVVWRCHVGTDTPNEHSEAAWQFLAPHLERADAYVFTREIFIPPVCDRARTRVIPPTIDPGSAKNQDLSAETARAILAHTGIVDGPKNSGSRAFVREDGSPGRVDRVADVTRLGNAPSWEKPLVVQVSRWDTLKDPIGVLRGFAALYNAGEPGAELVLAGPNVLAVSDDPEGPTVFREVVEAWNGLPEAQRRRIHLVNLPMEDVEENGAIVNALQRHAAIVVQKSLQEGFGLTVAEAMWKGRAVLASAVGGIQDQIQNGETGLLLRDPRDLEAFAGAVRRLLDEPTLATSLGRAGRERIREHYLTLQSLERWGALIEEFSGRELAGN
jgi:trehalose synthase